MVRGQGFGFLDNFHCEKISFITFGAMITTIYFALLAFVNNEFPTITIINEPITLLYLSMLVLTGGYLGVIFYRVTNKKRPIFVLQFWNAEA